MGTLVTLTVEGETRADAVAASESALDALQRAEQRLSTWRDDSELSRLNSSPVGTPFVSSAEMWQELGAAKRCHALTRGAFDPSVGALVRAWGLRAGGRRPSSQELAEATAAVGFDALETRETRTFVRRRADLVLEEGAFGKGAGLDRAIEEIASAPGTVSAVIDIGGQVAVWRSMHASTPEAATIGIADPLSRDRPLLAIAIDGGSLSTSGDSERGIVVDGRRYSHHIDPRTGFPAPDLGSVTVWAPVALAADCLSTGLFVLGFDEIATFASLHPELGIVVIRADRESGRRQAWASASLAPRLTSLSDDVELRYWGDASASRRASEASGWNERKRSAKETLSLESERP
jgi:thiamine biosynthesis lipoprotein